MLLSGHNYTNFLELLKSWLNQQSNLQAWLETLNLTSQESEFNMNDVDSYE